MSRIIQNRKDKKAIRKTALNSLNPRMRVYDEDYRYSDYQYEETEIFGRKVKYSGFWMNRNRYSHATPDAAKTLRLAAIKRAITNFVRIMTRRTDIVVKYATSDVSKTNGKTVILSGTADNNLDAVVGLALHESGHIMKSDFEIRSKTRRYIPSSIIQAFSKKYKMDEAYATNAVLTIIKDLHNIVEDRWIDNYIYTTCPGYMGYMTEMYKEYFYSDKVSYALKSASYRTEDWDSYIFRIINIVNINTDLRALKGLKEIWTLLDISNISRIKSSQETLNIAIKIFTIVEKYTIAINKPQPKSQPQDIDDADESDSGEGMEDSSSGSDDDSDDNGSSNDTESEDESNEDNCDSKSDSTDDSNEDENDENESSTTNEDNADEDNNDMENDGNSNDSEGEDGNDVEPELTPELMDAIADIIAKQREFLDDNVTKEIIKDAIAKQIISLEESGTELIEVGDAELGKTNVFVIRKMTQSIIDSGLFEIFSYDSGYNNCMQETINQGITLGKLLGKKIQVRNDERETKNTRLHSGKIDKRLLSSIGYGNEAVFHTTFIDTYEAVNLHISIDASGSMRGDKFNECILSSVAIAQAASMTKNINVKIDFRFTSDVGKTETPCVLIAYDSRIDKMVKIYSLFKYLCASGATPEGLCFQSIMEIILNDAKNKQAYFINYSDGQPYFSSNNFYYSKEVALNHTKRQIDIMRANGIKVLSYFIEHPTSNYINDFRKMYGKDAEAIDVTSIVPLAKTLNSKFLEK